MSANIEKNSLLENPGLAERLHALATRAHTNARARADKEGAMLTGPDQAAIAAQAFVKSLPENEAIVRGGIGIVRDIRDATRVVAALRHDGSGRASPDGQAGTDAGQNPFAVHPATDPELAFSADWAKSVEEVGKLALVTDLSPQDLNGIGVMIDLARNPDKQKAEPGKQPGRPAPLSNGTTGVSGKSPAL